MTKEPTTIGELFIFMEHEFTRINEEIKNIKKFVYWISGISIGTPTVIFSIIKLLEL